MKKEIMGNVRIVRWKSGGQTRKVGIDQNWKVNQNWVWFEFATEQSEQPNVQLLESIFWSLKLARQNFLSENKSVKEEINPVEESERKIW